LKTTKQQRAAELIANELAFQNEQEKRAAELINNNELIFQNEEKIKAQQNCYKEKAELYLEMAGSAVSG
jgi:hypothetical protein